MDRAGWFDVIVGLERGVGGMLCLVMNDVLDAFSVGFLCFCM